MDDRDADWDESWGRDDLPALTAPSGLEQTRDDTDVGWGERTWSGSSAGDDPDDLERFLREKPPHHGD